MKRIQILFSAAKNKVKVHNNRNFLVDMAFGEQLRGEIINWILRETGSQSSFASRGNTEYEAEVNEIF